ncbi:MAG: ABC transporter permease, partial [Pseudomonadota bacterium]
MTLSLLKSRELVLGAAILALLLAIASRFPAFIEPSNLAKVFNDTAPLIILALGQMAVILTRCIDLSVAANLALTGMVVAMLNTLYPGLPIPIILLVSILLGAVMGLANGLLVWKLDIPPIVVTLGTMTVYRGIIFLISDGAWINAHEMSESFKAFPRAVVLGLPVLSWIAILAVTGFAVLIGRTALGR